MNFSTHISGNNDLMKIGNFMADGICGKHFETFPIEIQRGIIPHEQ
jgi:acyl carrier protein phosphodiesterase